MARVVFGMVSLTLGSLLWAAPLPPLVCPAGGPIGGVDLRVKSGREGAEALPLRTINRLEEGDVVLYKPLLRSGEKRNGEVALVLVPADKGKAQTSLELLEPKAAGEAQQWTVPWRVGVVALVYGPAGLNAKKVKKFVSRDEDLIGQLADYAEKTAQTEALLATLASPASSSASVEAALSGFSSQYGLTAQLDKTQPTNQQALMLFRTLNPAIAGYDPISPQVGTQAATQTASLATSVATLFFGSPVGLAAGGTAMLMELRSVAFPRAEFRSSFSQPMPNDGLGLCGRRDPAPAHTKVAYLWAARVPNVTSPRLVVEKGASLPAAVRSPLPVSTTEGEWKFIERARNWALLPENGKAIPLKVQKLGDTKTLELELTPEVKPGKYTLAAQWDWDPFKVVGPVTVRPVSTFDTAKLLPASQDMLVSRTGKIPVTLTGSDFEFVTKVELLKLHDQFASPSAVPFLLPQGLRQGVQERMDVQINTIDLDPGAYKLMVTQLDGKAHELPTKILPAPPKLENLPVSLNEGTRSRTYTLHGEQLQLLTRLELAKGKAELGGPGAGRDRTVTLQMEDGLAAGTSLALKAYIQDRSEPLTFADAVRIVGPRPAITEVRVSQPPNAEMALGTGEIQGGTAVSAMLRVSHLQSNSVLALGCGGSAVELHLGERSGVLSFQQLAPDQVFVSFDTSAFVNGCELRAGVANGTEGESPKVTLGQVVRLPKIERFELDATEARLTGQNLEMIEKAGWTPEQCEVVAELPLPVPGEAPKQTLAIRNLPAAPATSETAAGTSSLLYVWLRGDAKPRAVRVGL